MKRKYCHLPNLQTYQDLSNLSRRRTRLMDKLTASLMCISWIKTGQTSLSSSSSQWRISVSLFFPGKPICVPRVVVTTNHVVARGDLSQCDPDDSRASTATFVANVQRRLIKTVHVVCVRLCVCGCVCVCPTLDKGSSTTTLSTLHGQGASGRQANAG